MAWIETCNVSLDVYCESPAALEPSERERIHTSCYRCGLAVCKSCSQVRLTWYPRDQKIRICWNCMQQESCLVRGCRRNDLADEHRDGLHLNHGRSEIAKVTAQERARWARHQHWAEHRGDPVPAGA